MSWVERYRELERKEGISSSKSSTKPSSNSWVNRYRQLEAEYEITKKKKKEEEELTLSDFEVEEEDRKWYQKGLLEDGYDFGDITKTILGISDKKELKTFEAPDTTDSLELLQKKMNNSSDVADNLKYTQQYNQMALAQYSDTLSKTKMDGKNHSVLEEIEILANMKKGEEKEKRKQAVLDKMESLGMDSSFYAHFAGDGEFNWDTFGKWMYNSSMAGLNTFNKGLLDTADLLLGAPMKAMGWENNPISEGAEYYNDLYSSYRYNADLLAEKLGGNAWNFGSDAVEGTIGALPNALLMFMTGGASTGATTNSLMNQAAMQTGNVLTKAGLTTSKMLKDPQYWMSFARTLGSDYKEAKEMGASDMAAAVGSVLKSTINSGIEIGIDGGSGIQGLDDALKKGGKPFWEWVESSLEEGGEEVLQKFVGEMVNKFGYGSDEEILNPIEYAKEGTLGVISGAALGGGQTVVQSGVNAYNEHQANKLTDMEQSVKDKIVEKRIAQKEKDGKTLTAKEKADIEKEVERNLRKGYLSADEIEEAIGGEVYESYKKDQMRSQMMGTVKDSRLAETYRELGRSKQKFQADVSKYTNENAKKTVQSILDSGLGDNSNQFHETVEWLAKLSEERNVTFDLTKTERLKGTKHYREGYVTNGFKTKNGNLTNITINLDGNVLNTTVGHEITHVMEEAGIYKELSKAVREFAVSKEGQEAYNARLAAVKEIYGEDQTTIDSEITADIIGEYLFTDYDFVHSLSTQNRNVFQKIYDEIKYMVKIATAGSKEQRELERVKKMFDKAWRENVKGKPETETDTDVQHSIVKDQKTIDWLENQEYMTVYKAMSLHDGKLYPPMSSQEYVDEVYTTKSGETKTRRVRKLKNPSELGKWQQADERPDLIKNFKAPSKKYPDGYGTFDLLKSNGKVTGDVAYNPYEHTSNIVLNDQFAEAYQRPELVTVEYHIPKSELTSGYKAQYAKDPVGLTDWKTGIVATKLTKNKREVYLTRWSKPVRIVPDSEVAMKYKELLDQEEGISVPWNVVTPSLRTELEKLGVPIDYSDIKAGSTIKNFQTEMAKADELAQKMLDTKSIQYSYSAIPTHKKSLEKNFDFENASLDLETINQRYDKIIGIWEKLGGELDSKFLNDWNNKTERPFTIFKAQSGYKYNVELSSMCKKGVPLFEAIDTIVKKEVMKELDMKVMGKAEKEILYDILKQKHFEIPCAICYVEQARQREGVIIDAFLNGKSATDKKGADMKLGWNQVLDSIQKEMKANGVDYTFNFVSREIATDKYIPAESNMDDKTYTAFAEAVKKIANEEITRYNKVNGKNRPLLKEVTPEAVKECFKGGLPSNLKIFKVLLTEPSSRFKIQNDLLYSSMTTQNLTMAHNGLYSLFNSQGGVSGYKTKQAPTVYWGDLLNKKWKPADTRKEGGIRNQSNSDFQMYTLLDQAQMYMDFSAKGYYLQAYTKVLSELKLFGLSRGKINASLIPQVKVYRNADGTVDVEKTMENAGLDENGNPIYDDIEGINHTEAFMLLEDPEYSKNIGGICIGYSDNHIRKLLDDARVQLIIGFHDKTNDPNKRYRGARYAKNYNGLNEATKLKADGTSETVHIGFNPFVKKAEQKFQYNKDTETFEGTITYKGKTYTADDIPRLATDLYLEHCSKKNLTPAYNEFSGHQNYYKLLADFSLYDSEGHYAPHQKVAYNMPDSVPYLDADGNKQHMSSEDYIKIELQKELAVRDSLIDALSDDSEDGIIPRFKAEVEKRNGTTQYSMTKATDKDYLDAVNRGDMETAQKMVEQSAKDSGYTEKVYHGTTGFGFTKIDLGMSDDGISFFATDSLETARTYSGQNGVKEIKSEQDEVGFEEIENAYDDTVNDFISLVNRTAGFYNFMDYDDSEFKWFKTQLVEGTATYDDVQELLDDRIEEIVHNLYENALYDNRELMADEFYESEEVNAIYEASGKLYHILKGIAEWTPSGTGNYQLLANTEGLFEIDADGNNWNRIPFQSTSGEYLVNTRRLAQYAKAEGYQGVKITNVFDDGGRSIHYQREPATVYIFFDPQTQVKSADPVTYDENGQVIPLTQRFNPKNDDIRYSISKGDRNDSGDWHIDGKDFGYTDEFEDFAPIREDVAENATTTETVSETESVAPEEEKDERTPAQHRREKSKGYTDFWADLIGDTSTWVDLPLGLSYKTKTLRRILRKVVRDANGKPDIQKADAIYDALETKYDHNEALLKKESAKLKGIFKELNLNKHEDTYAHMLGELRHNPETTLTEDVVKEYLNQHKKRINEEKVNKAIHDARMTFDQLIVRVNKVLREQGFQEIPYRQGYFPHFTNPKQNWWQKALNWKPIDNEIPTSIAGLTEMFKPSRSWQSFNKRRMGDTTDYSLYQGLDTYIHGALDWIYHIEDLQQRRSLENLIRYTHSEEGVKKRIEEIQNGDYDADEAQNMINAVLEEANNPLGGLVRELMNRTNTLANKKTSMDRAVEDLTSRKVYSVMTNLNNRITANQVVGSLSSAMTNFIPMVQSWHQVSPVYTVRGMGDYIRSVVKDDGMVEKSDFLTNRLMEEEKLYQTGWDKVSDKAAFMMNVVDSITSNTVWRSKYLQNLKEGMSETQAIKDADQFAKNLMAGRSRGNAPTIFDAKNPLVKMFTAFQLEVANQYGYMFDDVIKDSKSKARLVKGYATAFLGAYAYNALYSSLVGRDAAFDPISIIEELLSGLFDDEEEKEDVLMDFGTNILEEVPFVGGMLGGGRIPISSAFPYSGYSNPVESALSDISEGKFSKEWLKPLWYLAMPVAGGQVKKTIEGLSMFSDDHPVAGSYTDSGNLRFPVEDTFGNRVQAAMFGQYANKNARDYFDNNRSALKPDQIQEYMKFDAPIQDYWEYRDGLKGLDTIGEKADYINSLDLPISTKNMLINNQTDRKTPIDLTNYDEYDDFDEFDWATKNPEKYEFFSEMGISYRDYKKATDAQKDDYNWAYKYPHYYTLSKSVTSDVLEYRKYYKDLDAIKSTDEYGNKYDTSVKTRRTEYIDSLDIDYGAKLVLFKSFYKGDDSYNAEIFEYIKDKNDLTFEEKLSILKTLGYGVSDDGTVTWD